MNEPHRPINAVMPSPIGSEPGQQEAGKSSAEQAHDEEDDQVRDETHGAINAGAGGDT